MNEKKGDCEEYLTQSPFIGEGGCDIILFGDDMSRPKQQHYVPQVYLRHFCTNNNKSQLYFYDKVSQKSALTNIANIAQEKDFYSDISQEDKDHYEKYYSCNVEPTLGNLLSRIISTAVLCRDETPLLTDDDRSILSKMLIYQMFRTQNARRLMREKADAVSVPLTEQLLKLPEIKSKKSFRAIAQKYRILPDDKFKEISLPIAIEETRITRYAGLIDTMLCVFYDNRTSERFITSDNPIVIKRISTQDIGLGSAGLGYKDCMITYPINPRLTAVLCHNDFLYTLGFRDFENKKVPITQIEIVQTLNRWQLFQANRQVYSQTEFFM